MSNPIESVTTYYNDLNSRIIQGALWDTRHPDRNTQQYRDDELAFREVSELVENFSERGYNVDVLPMVFQSSYHPKDIRVSTADLLTAEIFNSILGAIVKLSQQ